MADAARRRCCTGQAGQPTAITVELPGGGTKTVSSRPEAIAAITRAGGGVIRGA